MDPFPLGLIMPLVLSVKNGTSNLVFSCFMCMGAKTGILWACTVGVNLCNCNIAIRQSVGGQGDEILGLARDDN